MNKEQRTFKKVTKQRKLKRGRILGGFKKFQLKEFIKKYSKELKIDDTKKN